QQTYTTITSAIAAAKDGDTVIVEGGRYAEKNIIVNRRIYLKGENYPVIDGQKKYEVITVTSDDVIIDGFKVINTGASSTEDMAGIKVQNSRNVAVINNIVDNTIFGIYFLNAVNGRIEKNQVRSYGTIEHQSGNGIHCWKSDSMRIIANTINGHRDGIYFEFVTNSIIWRNISRNNIRYGLHFMFSNNDAYIGNVFRNNGAGVAVMFSHHVKMFYNFFEENWGDAAYGLLLKEIRDSHIEANRFSRNTMGIYMEGASRISVQRNIFQKNGWGMKIQANCMEIAVERNNFLNNTFDVGTNGTLVLNTFNGNHWDKYEGYDLARDRVGDVPYRPVSLYSMIVEKNPPAMILFRSFITTLLDKTEKIIPSLTPENLVDEAPQMKPLDL
ncbi:MAG: Periplasmic copper-binding protein (NosD), partial [Chitinophagaceae bacterium]|nr:Periplasmic copper-binding protein (NosD) [Chitinophagaceae bacterium]